jgi:hypothetical protein
MKESPCLTRSKPRTPVPAMLGLAKSATSPVPPPPGEDAIDAIDHRGRRRYYLAPQPCRRTDAPRSTSAWWVAVVWLITIVLIAFPFPWWW